MVHFFCHSCRVSICTKSMPRLSITSSMLVFNLTILGPKILRSQWGCCHDLNTSLNLFLYLPAHLLPGQFRIEDNFQRLPLVLRLCKLGGCPLNHRQHVHWSTRAYTWKWYSTNTFSTIYPCPQTLCTTLPSNNKARPWENVNYFPHLSLTANIAAKKQFKDQDLKGWHWGYNLRGSWILCPPKCFWSQNRCQHVFPGTRKMSSTLALQIMQTWCMDKQTIPLQSATLGRACYLHASYQTKYPYKAIIN